MIQYKNGIVSDFLAGEDGWDDEMNTNLKRIDGLLERSVNGFVTSLPASPSNGDSYINTTNNTINIYFNSVWLTTALIVGSIYLNEADGRSYIFDGSSMALFTGAPSINTTVGASDAGKLVLTNLDGLVSPEFVGSVPSFANDAAYESFYGSPVGGERYFNTTSETFRRHLNAEGWKDEGEIENITALNIETSSGGTLNIDGAATITGDITISGAGSHSVSEEFADEVTNSTSVTAANAIRDKAERFKQLLVASGPVTGTNIGAVNVTSGNITSLTYTVLSPTLDLTTTGKPVMICMLARNSAGVDGQIKVTNTNSGAKNVSAYIGVVRDGSLVSDGIRFGGDMEGNDETWFGMPGMIFLDAPAAGTYSYRLDAKVSSGNARLNADFQFLIYEML